MNVPNRPPSPANREPGDSANSASLGSDSPAGIDLPHTLSAASSAQDKVISAVETLLEQLSGKADYGRVVRELSQLWADQVTHTTQTRRDIGLDTLPLTPDELTREQRSRLHQAASGEDTLARRFDKIAQSIDWLGARLDLIDVPASNRLKGAAALARQLAIGAHLQEAANDLAANRVGRGLELEAQIDADIAQVLDKLRDRPPDRQLELASVKQAESELTALRQQVADLRGQAARAAAERGASGEQQRLGRRQERLRQESERLARRLDQMGARGASQSTQKAADRLGNGSAGGKLNAPPRPGAPEDLQQAEQNLDDAARQLADRRLREEFDLALEFINHFRGELEQMIKRQQTVIAQTADVEAERATAGGLSPTDTAQFERLAAEERELAQLALEHREVLNDLGAVRVSLAEAERRLRTAGDLLARHDPGATARQAERSALTRLQSMMEAFAQTAAEAQPKRAPKTPARRRPTSRSDGPRWSCWKSRCCGCCKWK